MVTPQPDATDGDVQTGSTSGDTSSGAKKGGGCQLSAAPVFTPSWLLLLLLALGMLMRYGMLRRR